LFWIERDDLALANATGICIPGRSRRHPRLIVCRLERAVDRRPRQRVRPITKIGRIKVILAGNTNEREQGVAARVGQRRAHALGICGFGNSTYRPVRGDPFARGMSEHGGQIDQACLSIDRGGLNRCDLVLAKRLAHDVKTA
jgi:hypothetical protein